MSIHHSDPPWIAELRQNRGEKRFGQEILFFSSIDSTNRQAKEESRRGAPEGLVIIADGQSEGKGRKGRTWESPPGVNLHASIVLRLSIPIAAVPRITLLTGLAVARALRLVSGLCAFIKWPNDVLIGGKKIAGILAEIEVPREGGALVILGIGVNVNWKADEFPKGLAEIASSLRAEAGREFAREEVAGAIFDHLKKVCEDFRKEGFCLRLREGWNRLSWVNEEWVRADTMDQVLEGRVLGLDTNGALLLLDRGGENPPSHCRRHQPALVKESLCS